MQPYEVPRRLHAPAGPFTISQLGRMAAQIAAEFAWIKAQSGFPSPAAQPADVWLIPDTLEHPCAAATARIERK